MNKKETIMRYFRTGVIVLFIFGISFIGGKYFFSLKTKSNKIVKKANLDTLAIKDNSLNKEEEKESETVLFWVDIKGAVVNPGVYQMKEGQRILDVIEMAGGLVNNADTSVINLSKKIRDQMVIYIYTIEEVMEFEQTLKKQQIKQELCLKPSDMVINDACVEEKIDPVIEEEKPKISINDGKLEDLIKLPGIGEAKAKSIIDYREKNGHFQSLDEIKNVDGIGEELFVKIKENITL